MDPVVLPGVSQCATHVYAKPSTPKIGLGVRLNFPDPVFVLLLFQVSGFPSCWPIGLTSSHNGVRASNHRVLWFSSTPRLTALTARSRRYSKKIGVAATFAIFEAPRKRRSAG